MKYIISIVAIAFLIVSCSHGKTRHFPSSKNLTNPAEIIIIRNKNITCGAQSTTIVLDGLPIAHLRMGEYVSFFVESGVHYLRVRESNLYGHVEEQKKYYFLISINFFDMITNSYWGDSCGFEIEKISEEEGLKRIRNSKNLIKMEKEYKSATEAAPTETEKPESAFIPESATVSEISLRRQPLEISTFQKPSKDCSSCSILLI